MTPNEKALIKGSARPQRTGGLLGLCCTYSVLRSLVLLLSLSHFLPLFLSSFSNQHFKSLLSWIILHLSKVSYLRETGPAVKAILFLIASFIYWAFHYKKRCRSLFSHLTYETGIYTTAFKYPKM